MKGANFTNKSNCSKRLESLIDVNPDDYHPELIEKALSNSDTFLQLGELNTNKLSSNKFNKKTFHAEKEADSLAMPSIRSMCQR